MTEMKQQDEYVLEEQEGVEITSGVNALIGDSIEEKKDDEEEL